MYFIDYTITIVPISFSSLSTSALHSPSYEYYCPLSSCLQVVHISSLASTFPILFLPSPVYFLPTIYATYSLYLFLPFSPCPLPADNPLCGLHFCDSVPFLVVCLVCFCFLDSAVDSCEFIVILLLSFYCS